MTTPQSPAGRFRPRAEPLDPRLAPAVTFRFDATLDTGGFFANPAARAALQRAADAVGSQFGDALLPIAPGGGNSWVASFRNPVTDDVVAVDNLFVGPNELVVFVGAGDLDGATLGSTGPGAAAPQGTAAWARTVRARGQDGALARPATDYGPWGGMVAFDTRAAWDFGPGDPPPGRLHFESVAAHELAHVLGFGAGTPSFDRYVTAGGFVGPNVVAAYGGPAPLDPGPRPDHWAEGTASDGREAALTAAIGRGERRPLTRLDLAALADIGWDVTEAPAPPPPPARPPPPPVPAGAGPAAVAVGAGEGGGPVVTRLAADGRAVGTFQPFPAGFAGGVRVASADFDRDGVLDVAVGTGPGAATLVRVLSGTDQRELFAVAPFEAAFTGGVFVAAGDVTGDGVPDLVVTPDEGGGPRVRVFSGAGFAQVADFLGIDDPAFRGGARAAVGDVDGDGGGDLLVAAGFGGGPRVAGYDGRRLGPAGGPKLFADFLAFEPGLRNGVYLAAGDLDGDGAAEVVAGAGPGGGPRVTAWSGRALAQAGRRVVRADFFAGDPAGRGGARVAAADLNGDRRADLVAGAGAGSGAWAAGYLGRAVPAAGAPPAAFDYTIYPGFTGGVFVG